MEVTADLKDDNIYLQRSTHMSLFQHLNLNYLPVNSLISCTSSSIYGVPSFLKIS